MFSYLSSGKSLTRYIMEKRTKWIVLSSSLLRNSVLSFLSERTFFIVTIRLSFKVSTIRLLCFFVIVERKISSLKPLIFNISSYTNVTNSLISSSSFMTLFSLLYKRFNYSLKITKNSSCLFE